MKFLNEIDGAKRVKQDSNNRFVTDAEKQEWDSKASGNHNHNMEYEPKNTNIQSHIDSKSNPHGITKSQVGLGSVDNTSDLTKPISTATQSALNEKVDNSRVLTDVPINAKFTDTVYSHPSSHPASMITESSTKRFVSDTKISEWNEKETTTGSQAKADAAEQNANDYADAGLADKVDKVTGKGLSTNDYTTAEKNKLSGIATGANNYTHPSSHPASMITGLPSSLPANGGNANTSEHLIGDDTRDVNSNPSVYMSGGSRYVNRAGWQTEFKRTSTIGLTGLLSGTYCYLQTHTPWSDPSGGYPIQVAYGNGTPCWRVGVSTSAWSVWQKMNDGGNASTVNGFTVGANVPSNAKFTDTNTTYGVVTTSANGLMLATDKSKLNGIEAGANNYTHPSSHPASFITESSTKRFVSDTEKSTWNSKSDTDTVTTINGKTGVISKADIVALGIPSQDTNTTYSEITTAEIDTGTASTRRTITGRRVKYILDKIQGWINGLTKSDIGLSNVDNTSDLAKPISTAAQTQFTAINTKINNLNKGGNSLFAGNGLEKTIPHGLGSVPTSAYAFPNVNPEGFLGEVWVRFDATNIYVGNTGSFTGAMVWGVIK